MRILGTHHVALTTTRFERLRDFYVETLGLPVVGGFPGQEILFIAAGTTAIELIGETSDDERERAADDRADRPAVENRGTSYRARRTGWHHLAWEVDDVDEAYVELLARGVTPHSPPEDFPDDAPTMRIAFLQDPDGNLIELVQPLGLRYPSANVRPQA
jgi:catechol 2,3-dioxygenase-like lactoylglutathione lyase family enzyme